jgi:Tol biopolymer transport system component
MRPTTALIALAALPGLLACADSPTDPPPPPPPPPSPAAELCEVDPVGPATVAIAFVSTRDGAEHIYVANADGSGVTCLTEGSAPAWSWDGEKIAFVRPETPDGPNAIYTMNFDGSGLRNLGPGASPAWSPDGRIAFTRATGWTTSGLYVMNADGSGVEPLLLVHDLPGRCSDWPCWFHPGIGAAAWSPDGRSLVVREYFSSQTFVLNAAGSGLREIEELPGSAGAPAWSPDGSRIAAIRQTDPRTSPVEASSVIYTYDPISGDQDVITLVHQSAVRAEGLDWSPDASHMVLDLYDPTRSVRRRRIHVVSTVTGEIRQLIPDADAAAEAHYEDYGPVWSRGMR